ncbi:MAG TPA: RNase adapter RapZ [Terriglobales bacterium]|nr:RNase adapter RapZ [Terriglobales bacterium]
MALRRARPSKTTTSVRRRTSHAHGKGSAHPAHPARTEGDSWLPVVKSAHRPGRHPAKPRITELVIITGMSGSGKASVLKAFEDLGYYCVDNLPVDLIPRFAELAQHSGEIERTALVLDVREGGQLERLPAMLKSVKKMLPTTVIYLEASDQALIRRFSETRRPHPLGTDSTVKAAVGAERRRLRPIRAIADLVIDTSKFNVHELRSYVTERFQQKSPEKGILVSCVSFGYRHGVPEDADLVFDVRFLPNPHFVPEFRALTGRDSRVVRYILSFPQTQEFISRISELLVYLLPHYVREGKSYLTISFGCTGGQHRSVMIAEDVGKRLRKAGYKVKILHRDSPK